jgi:hypothetical protein
MNYIGQAPIGFELSGVESKPECGPCPRGARCADGKCVCLPGFVEFAPGSCTRVDFTVALVSPAQAPLEGGTAVSVLFESVTWETRPLLCRFGEAAPVQCETKTNAVVECVAPAAQHTGMVELAFALPGEQSNWTHTGVLFFYIQDRGRHALIAAVAFIAIVAHAVALVVFVRGLHVHRPAFRRIG